MATPEPWSAFYTDQVFDTALKKLSRMPGTFQEVRFEDGKWVAERSLETVVFTNAEVCTPSPLPYRAGFRVYTAKHCLSVEPYCIESAFCRQWFAKCSTASLDIPLISDTDPLAVRAVDVFDGIVFAVATRRHLTIYSDGDCCAFFLDRGGLNTPFDLGVLEDGRLAVVYAEQQRVQVVAVHGRHVTSVCSVDMHHQPVRSLAVVGTAVLLCQELPSVTRIDMSTWKREVISLESLGCEGKAAACIATNHVETAIAFLDGSVVWVDPLFSKVIRRYTPRAHLLGETALARWHARQLVAGYPEVKSSDDLVDAKESPCLLNINGSVSLLVSNAAVSDALYKAVMRDDAVAVGMLCKYGGMSFRDKNHGLGWACNSHVQPTVLKCLIDNGTAVSIFELYAALRHYKPGQHIMAIMRVLVDALLRREGSIDPQLGNDLIKVAIKSIMPNQRALVDVVALLLDNGCPAAPDTIMKLCGEVSPSHRMLRQLVGAGSTVNFGDDSTGPISMAVIRSDKKLLRSLVAVGAKPFRVDLSNLVQHAPVDWLQLVAAHVDVSVLKQLGPGGVEAYQRLYQRWSPRAHASMMGAVQRAVWTLLLCAQRVNVLSQDTALLVLRGMETAPHAWKRFL